MEVGTDPRALALEVLDALVAGDWARARGRFGPDLASRLSEAEIASTWRSTIEQLGSFDSRDEPTTKTRDGAVVVEVPCRFERASVQVSIAVADDRVVGLGVMPRAPDVEHPIAPYVNGAAFEERPMRVGADGWPLPATLTLPRPRGVLKKRNKPPHPAIVFVHGSGPHDRDETLGGNKVFLDLAFGLAARGIATLRYEKRTREHTGRISEAKDFTVREEVIDDALAAVAAVRARPEIDRGRVFLLGHSLGGMLAPAIGLEDPTIAGLIVLAGPTRPLEDTLLDQYRYLAGHGDAGGRGVLEQLETQVARVKKLTPKSRTKPKDLPLATPVSYWLSLRAHDPLVLAPRATQPMLILQGERDYQVTMEDLAGWRRALDGRPDITIKSYAALNHTFAPGTGPCLPAEYMQPAYVDPQVIADIADWIAKH